MYSIVKPAHTVIRAFLDQQRALPLSYADPGLTREFPQVGASAPAGFDLDHCRVQLGCGSDVFAAACLAIDEWRMFDIGWVDLCWPETSTDVGAVVAVLARPYGLWSLSACRIVYTIGGESLRDVSPDSDIAASSRRYGFAYGTLPNHIERGEERFTVEWRDDDTVWYDLLAISRPGHWLTHAAYPLVRRWQGAFRRDSLAAMLRAVTQSTVNVSR